MFLAKNRYILEADFAEIFHIDISQKTLYDRIKLVKLLPSCARIYGGIGFAETVSALELGYRSANSKKKQSRHKFDWLSFLNENDNKEKSLTALERSKREYEQQKNMRKNSI